MTAGRPRTLSERERALWRAATRDARRLDGVAAAPVAPVPEQEPVQRHTIARRPRAVAAAAGEQAPTLDRRTAEKLRRGQLPIEARLDLHGMTQEVAQRALTAFVSTMAAAGRRNLLVITGKGVRHVVRSGREAPEDGMSVGILRREVPRWLNQPGLRESVLAVCQAAPRDGGGGALYVLLRRQRRSVGVDG